MENDEPERRLLEFIGLNFRLPVWVRDGKETWNSECDQVTLPVMPWLKKQREVVESTLDRICARREGSSWILAKSVSSQWLLESTYTDPEDVVIWNWIDKEVPIDADFISEYCRHRDAVFCDPSHVRILWASMSKFMLWWVLHKNRPIDFGFMKLTCVPLRRNWITVLMRGYKIAKRVRNFNRAAFFRRNETCDNLTAWDETSETIRWDLIAIPTKRFYDASKLIELQRKRNDSNVHYVNRVRLLIKAHYQRINEIFEAYMAQTDFKNVGLSPSKPARGWNVGFNQRKRNRYAASVETSTSNVDHLNGVGRVLEKGSEAGVAGEDESLLTVSNLQLLCEDLRNPVGNVASAGVESTDSGATRLHVLDASEGEAAGELLSVRPSERDDAEHTLAGASEQLPASADRNGEEK